MLTLADAVLMAVAISKEPRAAAENRLATDFPKLAQAAPPVDGAVTGSRDEVANGKRIVWEMRHNAPDRKVSETDL